MRKRRRARGGEGSLSWQGRKGGGRVREGLKRAHVRDGRGALQWKGLWGGEASSGRGASAVTAVRPRIPTIEGGMQTRAGEKWSRVEWEGRVARRRGGE